ncbi:hypothetical protein DA792_06330 [Celeribacter baekdonensis]|uniref:PilZ domain-containing protein n=1 Tax=Celeribacter baekdonensis TaxID=875171 RepID=A0A2R4M0Q2_9RHOB|nr:hypothetical protein DA792_06330 [Celeribacter baekdonensis]
MEVRDRARAHFRNRKIAICPLTVAALRSCKPDIDAFSAIKDQNAWPVPMTFALKRTFWIFRAGFAPIAVFCLASVLFIATPAFSAPSCRLESWLSALDDSANTYIKSLGTADELQAARSFRIEMERYERDKLLKQINAAGLGSNEKALFDFIASRHHLLDLQRDNWGEMARRYGTDPRFSSQSQSLSHFLSATACDPSAPDFLESDGKQKSTFLDRVREGVKEIVDVVAHEDPKPAAQTALTFDPNNFDEFRPTAATAPTASPVTLSPSGNAAFALGIFTFISAITSWAWMRYGIVQRRATRYPCTLPVVIFDGIVPVLGEILDMSQIGAKLETTLELYDRQKIKLTIGPVVRKARVMWRSNHFIGVKFDKLLTEAEMKYLLGDFAQQVGLDRDTAPFFDPNADAPADDAAALEQAFLSSDRGDSTREDTQDLTPASNPRPPDPDLAA